MDPKHPEQDPLSPASEAWVEYYANARKRRGGHGDLDHRRLRQQRKRRRISERFGILASLIGVGLLAWLFDALLAR